MRVAEVYVLVYLVVVLFVLISRAKDLDSACEEGIDSADENTRYLLYGVNSGEGFNLSRDVYMRMARLLHQLNSSHKHSWKLVLPPWGPFYHWKFHDSKLPWKYFFDIASLNKYIPVVEFSDFIKYFEAIDRVYYLQHYEEGWDSDDWEEKLDLRPCIEVPPYRSLRDNKNVWEGWFWGYDDVITKSFNCVSVQGFSQTLLPLILKHDVRSVMIDRAEVVMHDEFGSSEFWKIRRSMRFASHLVSEAEQFRKKYLNSCDMDDGTTRPEDWRDDHIFKKREKKGGSYIAVHLRRRDFLKSRATQTPSLAHAAKQIQKKAKELNITTIFIATDGSKTDMQELVRLLPQLSLFRYETTSERLKLFREGGIAIIDQIICSKARHFIGSYESTFSFRIQEEREIMGFPLDSTFNRLCGNKDNKCEQPTRWKISW